jgi:dihydrofolate synthase/folylpolyglutamate synthase
MTPAQALSYLDSLIELGIKVGLGHTRVLAEVLGDPQDRFPSILIGGTNGKGSTASFLAAILQAAGCRTGLYTSPHLVDVTERIQVQGKPIPLEELAQGLDRVRAASEAAMESASVEGFPTYFEALTLAAFDHFSRAAVDVAVLEVGLGGRLDCTNVVQPQACIVTNIGLDHEDWLGQGLQAVAREKAGIFKPRVPAYTAARDPEVLAILGKEALKAGAWLHPLHECELSARSDGWALSERGNRLELPLPGLPGAHQIENAALAVLCCWGLMDQGWQIPDEAIRTGIAGAQWPGRLEKIAPAPDTYLDGAHNVEGCECLARFVRTLPHTPKVLVFTAMKDKPLASMAGALFSSFDEVIATSLPMPRCLAGAEIALRLPRAGVRSLEDAAEALGEARKTAGPSGLVVAAGSLYLVGYLKAARLGVPSATWGSGL